MSTRQLVVADHVALNDGRGTVLSRGVIEIQDGRITAVDHLIGGTPFGADVVDLGEVIVMPGLVNTHAHTPMSLMRGIAEGHSLLTMDGFLQVLRTREAHLTPELVAASVAVSCADFIRHGTTTFADQYFYADEIAPVVQASGLRARIAWGIVELGDPEVRARELAACAAFIEGVPEGDGRVGGWVGPHAFFVDNRPEAMVAERELALRLGVGLHAHFSTSSEEDEFTEAEYGKPALQVLREMAMFDVPTILAHCNTVPVEQLHLLADTRATMSLIPSVAMQSGAAAAPVRAALDAGITVGLGTDNVVNNTNSDLFEEMRTLGKLATFVSGTPNQVSPREILEIATVNGHRAIAGGNDDGRLLTGAVADLIAIPLSDLWQGPVGAQSVEAAMVYCTSGASVRDSMVAGEWLMRDRILSTIDLPAALAAQQRDHALLAERMRQGRSGDGAV